MNAATRKALEGSIRKWRKIIKGTGRDDGSRNCPLCAMFLRAEGVFALSCGECPVRKRTGHHECHDTPYVQWFHSTPRGGMAKTKKQIAAAQAELDFLISLRP